MIYAGQPDAFDTEEIELLSELAGDLAFGVAALRQRAERKRAEVALRESEASLKEAQNIASLGRYVLDIPSGRWSSSDLLDKLFGIDKAFNHSVEGWTTLIHPADRAMMADYLKNEVLGRKQAFDREYRIVRHDNQAERWVHGLGRITLDDQGRPVEMHGTIQDITERKLAAQRVADELNFTQTVLRVSPVGVVTFNASGPCVSANESIGQILGGSREAVLKQNFR
jgi:PAS domain S-box-containing protein